MEGSKNAMYEQAGRVRGWTVGTSGEAAKPKHAAPPAVVPAMPTPAVVPAAPVTEHMTEPVTEFKAVTIPPPPVVMIPDTYVPREEYAAPKADCEVPVMAYVAPQKWRELYEPEKGFTRGTIFTEIDLPFVGEGACRYE